MRDAILAVVDASGEFDFRRCAMTECGSRNVPTFWRGRCVRVRASDVDA